MASQTPVVEFILRIKHQENQIKPDSAKIRNLQCLHKTLTILSTITYIQIDYLHCHNTQIHQFLKSVYAQKVQNVYSDLNPKLNYFFLVWTAFELLHTLTYLLTYSMVQSPS